MKSKTSEVGKLFVTWSRACWFLEGELFWLGLFFLIIRDKFRYICICVYGLGGLDFFLRWVFFGVGAFWISWDPVGQRGPAENHHRLCQCCRIGIHPSLVLATPLLLEFWSLRLFLMHLVGLSFCR